MATIHVLSKSTFLRGLQCDKSLYLYKHFYNLRDETPPNLQAIFDRGTNLGMMAQRLFPGGVDASPESPFKYAESVALTKKLIEQGQKVIYETAFVHEGVLIATDILVNENGLWTAYEVKSSTKVTDVYKMDVSIQFWEMQGAGIPLEDIFIVHLNNQYVKQGAIDVQHLFTKVSVKRDVLRNLSDIPENVKRLKAVISKPAVPDIPIGSQCFNPYPCDFMGHCWKNIPEGSVFELGGMHKKKLFEMYHDGIKRVVDVPDSFSLKKDQRIQVEQTRKNQPLIEKAEIQSFLEDLRYPIFFFDLETFMPAIPIYDGTHPFEHIPFQYSLHYKESKDAELKHFEFLAETGIDPRLAFTENVLKDFEKPGDILVYNRQFEVSVLNNLSHHFPQHEKPLRAIVSRIKDLMIPFKKKWYYHPNMKGSYSIKEVLPALVPKLNHKELNISGGSMAMNAFEQLQTETDLFKIAEIRENLLEYCKLDTYAMVRILEVLEEAIT